MTVNQSQLYIGIMSGTSADGIDLALVDFSTGKPDLIASYYQAYDETIYQKITELYQPNTNEIDKAFTLDVLLAKQFSQAIEQFIAQEKIDINTIAAIGNHGQTIRHRPNITSEIATPFTLQIGCNQTLATLTGIKVIGDFRTKDMVLGGQGAPLVPAFHKALFPNEPQDVFVINIGGIANVTFLPVDKSKSILGFDTGPGNALIDDWYKTHKQGRFDNNGEWAQSGNVNTALLNHFLKDDYLTLSAPKSTGREYFNMDWVNKNISQFLQTSASNSTQEKQLLAEDIQATLTALTAQTITDQVRLLSTKANVYLCGGGTLNIQLFYIIKQNLRNFNVTSSDTININSDALEASAFAWFAYAFDKKITGNIPAVTGARKEAILGIEYQP
ncbi:anhydro-N-acetylmuramic acid kinase [Colwellia sp. UCD-KL20]|uniref:anhydro-N-acetylmuramic acid kinase n=1 Tax=Colwellia sp. UCD-KL20 TaxID=1917165 RepID=UPI000971145D|nr:anhydro-N-acetylmuramic acid kinase [Colwellia sp. UCD-KL20]